jgi:hypothetical protein
MRCCCCCCSDNEGAIWLYDVNTQQLVSEYEAHNKRVWALDYAPAVASSSGAGSSAGVLGPSGHVFASGSDDYTVKVDVLPICTPCWLLLTRPLTQYHQCNVMVPMLLFQLIAYMWAATWFQIRMLATCPPPTLPAGVEPLQPQPGGIYWDSSQCVQRQVLPLGSQLPGGRLCRTLSPAV